MPRILYFAQLADAIGMTSEALALPAASVSVAELLQILAARDAKWQRIFADPAKLRITVNKSFASLDTRVGPDDEVAFVPTGSLA